MNKRRAALKNDDSVETRVAVVGFRVENYKFTPLPGNEQFSRRERLERRNRDSCFTRNLLHVSRIVLKSAEKHRVCVGSRDFLSPCSIIVFHKLVKIAIDENITYYSARL